MLRRTLRRLGGGGDPQALPQTPSPCVSPAMMLGGIKQPPPPPPLMLNAAVVLSGCGVYDGAEICESVSTLICLEAYNFTYTMCAPDRPMFHVIDHAKGAPMAGEKRSIMTEAARIARGPVTPLADIDPSKFDALVFPGGFGVMKNLSTFAVADAGKGAVHDDVAALIRGFAAQKKPIAACCIAPVLVAAVLGPEAKVPLKMTMGSKTGDAQALAESFGNVQMHACDVKRALRDLSNHIVSTPAYMSADATPLQVYTGISDTIKHLRKAATESRTGTPDQRVAV